MESNTSDLTTNMCNYHQIHWKTIPQIRPITNCRPPRVCACVRGGGAARKDYVYCMHPGNIART